MFDLSQKVALVAGGAGYLGLPVCRGLAEQGAAVMVADVNRAGLDKAAARVRAALPRARVDACFLDVASEDSCRQAVAQTASGLGGLHILVNLTTQSAGRRVEDIAEAEFDRALHANVYGALALARAAADAMAPGGSIILFASMYGQVAPRPALYQPPMNPNPLDYGVGKAGIIQMAKYLAVYWAPRGIRVNAVAPGPFPNPAVQASDPAFIERLAGQVPLGRIGRPEECAGAVAFLASDDASYITGQTLAVNGGWTAW